MSQFNIDKNKYDEALRKSCKGKIEEEKRLQGFVEDVKATIQRLYREKHTIINDIEEKQSISTRVQLLLDDMNRKLASLREDVRIQEIGLQAKAEAFEKEKEDFRKERERVLERFSDKENSLDTRELNIDGKKNRHRIESDRLENDKVELKERLKKFDEERLNFKEQQHKFNEEKKKHNEENAKYKAEISRIQLKGKEQSVKDKLQREQDNVLNNKKKNLDITETQQRDKDIEQKAMQVRLDEQERRINNLIEIHKVK